MHARGLRISVTPARKYEVTVDYLGLPRESDHVEEQPVLRRSMRKAQRNEDASQTVDIDTGENFTENGARRGDAPVTKKHNYNNRSVSPPPQVPKNCPNSPTRSSKTSLRQPVATHRSSSSSPEVSTPPRLSSKRRDVSPTLSKPRSSSSSLEASTPRPTAPTNSRSSKTHGRRDGASTKKTMSDDDSDVLVLSEIPSGMKRKAEAEGGTRKKVNLKPVQVRVDVPEAQRDLKTAKGSGNVPVASRPKPKPILKRNGPAKKDKQRAVSPSLHPVSTKDDKSKPSSKAASGAPGPKNAKVAGKPKAAPVSADTQRSPTHTTERMPSSGAFPPMNPFFFEPTTIAMPPSEVQPSGYSYPFSSQSGSQPATSAFGGFSAGESSGSSFNSMPVPGSYPPPMPTSNWPTNTAQAYFQMLLSQGLNPYTGLPHTGQRHGYNPGPSSSNN